MQARRGFRVLPLQDGEAVLAVQEVVQGVELDLLAVELEAVLRAVLDDGRVVPVWSKVWVRGEMSRLRLASVGRFGECGVWRSSALSRPR